VDARREAVCKELRDCRDFDYEQIKALATELEELNRLHSPLIRQRRWHFSATAL
jgi:hypothetical protein